MAKFRKRIKIAPGVNLNLSKSGVSGTFGVKGASVNVGKNGAYLNTGIPGTGIYDRKKLGGANGDTANETAEDDGIFVKNPTPEQTAALGRVFGIVLLVIGGLILLLSFWLGFGAVGNIFMAVCFLLGLICVAPSPKTATKDHEVTAPEQTPENGEAAN